MELTSVQPLVNIQPTQEEREAVARLMDAGAERVDRNGHIRAPHIVAERIMKLHPELKRRENIAILYEPFAHVICIATLKPPEPAPIEKVTLARFVEDNERMLAVLGVLLGAAVFTNSSSVKPIGQFITFCLIGAALFLWTEIIRVYRETAYPPAGQLQVFILFLFAAFLGAVFYWLLEFGRVRQFALATVLFQLGYNVLLADKLEAVTNKVKYAILLVLIFTVSFAIAFPLNLGLDKLNEYLSKSGIEKRRSPDSQPVE